MSSVFAALYAGQYDNLYSEKRYAEECDLIEKIWAREGVRPQTVLDIGCGTGSHTLELAGRGYQCTGVDLSPHMIEAARQKSATQQPVRMPDWHVGDARSFSTGTTYDAAIMMFAVVGYLTTNDDVLAGLRNARRHLVPGAPFICDFWYGPTVLSVRPSERVRLLEKDGRKTLRAASTSVDTFAQTADVSFRLWSIEGDKFLGETQEVHKMRYFFPQEFKLLLSAAGFEAVEIMEFPTLAPLEDTSWNAICTARAI